MTVFSKRLKEERQRLGLNQTAFASLGGVSKDAQLNYENGSRRPDSTYLEAVASHGVDVLYALTGQRNVTSLSADEGDLVRRYREAPAVVRVAAFAALVAGAMPGRFPVQHEGEGMERHAGVVHVTIAPGSAHEPQPGRD
ncbi:phage DNA-binding protein [Burkholderia lata]|uniref:Phage DNA-binding protein n=1 Tax=Burkholderia lata (strain ATCC 17760 / DSM 23089 / LMG 22485 / NCIMB 9086 / R18194 / 383) TaxID=482957 RepID=A0A6P2XH54_BURL3|nr:helix-turn-helix transcriptional regulator [Burkholderia lata]VWD08644.1 phage DNA-binding protein [Burkholderia lata]